MTKVDFFGHWFYFFLFTGMLLLQAKDYRGWAFRFAGEVGWIGIGLVMGMSSIWAWGFAFLAVDVLGYLKWQKEEQELAALEQEQTEWTASASAYLDEVFPEVGGPDCTGTTHQPHCRDYVAPIKVKKNVKAKRNTAPKRQSQRKKVATKRSRPTNRKVQPRRGRSSK